ncbi:MAG: hypothetical protein V4640_09175 [Verrucomicrobiota bacterium]
MRSNTNQALLPLVLALGLTAGHASAQNPNYTEGDLVLYFQEEGGTNTVYANLGNAATLFRGSAAGPGATNKINFLNINAALVSAFGASWANSESIYAGLAGVYSTNSTNATAVVNGDPYRTLYISAARTAIGSVGQAASAGYTLNTNTGMTNGASFIYSQNNILETSYLDAVVVSPTGTSRIDDQNPFTAPGIQDTAFGVFGGGVQQVGTASSFGSFGAAGTVEFALDLYRILARDTVPGQVAGDLRVGSFEGTITLNSGGMVSFISQGAGGGSAFDSWALTFPALDTALKREKAADPDNDGLSNLLEFVLNGNPGASDTSVAPALDAATSDFVFTFTRRDDSEAGTTLLFQYGSDLAGWTSAAIGAASLVTGDATITVTQGATTDAITVRVPKTVAPSGTLFGRLKVTQ